MTNDLTDLRALIEFASERIEMIFRKSGVIHSMYHAIAADGKHELISPASDDKDIAVALMRAAFELRGIDRYVFCDEAWIIDTSKSGRTITEAEWAKIRREGLRNHPDRREIVMFSAENRRGEQLLASRYILRPEHGKATLMPLAFQEIFDKSEGRMVGLLKKER